MMPLRRPGPLFHARETGVLCRRKGTLPSHTVQRQGNLARYDY
jgi:hypothetical protein